MNTNVLAQGIFDTNYLLPALQVGTLSTVSLNRTSTDVGDTYVSLLLSLQLNYYVAAGSTI